MNENNTSNYVDELNMNETKPNSEVSISSISNQVNKDLNSLNKMADNGNGEASYSQINQKKKNNLPKILIFIALLLITIGGGFLFLQNGKGSGNSSLFETGKSNNSQKNVAKTYIEIGTGKLATMRVLTEEGKYYVYNKDSKKLEEDISSNNMKDYQHNFYLDNNGTVYLNYTQMLKANGSQLYDGDYVKLFSNSSIKKMSTTGLYYCGLFMDTNNDVYAYNLLMDKYDAQTTCGFDKRYNFDLILENVKDIFVSRNSYYGYVSQDDILYIKDKFHPQYQEILKDVQEMDWPYVITKDKSIYQIFKRSNQTVEPIVNKVDNKAEKFIENSVKIEDGLLQAKVYVANNRLYLTEDSNSSEFLSNEFLTKESNEAHFYVNVVKANDIKQVIYYNAQASSFSVIPNVLVLLDKNNKLQVYKGKKKEETYNYDLQGLEKVYQFIEKEEAYK